MIEINNKSQYIELQAVGEGDWITQSHPTNFHEFWKRKMVMTEAEIEDYMEVTDKQKAALEAQDAAWEEPPKSFINRWNICTGAYGCYNNVTGYFELNGLKDITYEQAQKIDKGSGNCVAGVFKFGRLDVRTFYPLIGANGMFNLDTTRCFTHCSKLEVLRLDWYFPVSPGIFNSCTSLRRIYGGLSNMSANPTVLSDLSNLEYVEIVLSGNIDLSGCRLLEASVFKYILANRRNTKEAIVKVHPEVFDKLTSNVADWEGILDIATECQVLFARD